MKKYNNDYIEWKEKSNIDNYVKWMNQTEKNHTKIFLDYIKKQNVIFDTDHKIHTHKSHIFNKLEKSFLKKFPYCKINIEPVSSPHAIYVLKDVTVDFELYNFHKSDYYTINENGNVTDKNENIVLQKY